jgi:hypothetical protein
LRKISYFILTLKARSSGPGFFARRLSAADSAHRRFLLNVILPAGMSINALRKIGLRVPGNTAIYGFNPWKTRSILTELGIPTELGILMALEG